MRNKRVLIIGHNVFDSRTAFGKTLTSFFKGWDSQNLAELYFHSEVPTMDICSRYYRITDTDALKSIFRTRGHAVGRSFNLDQIDTKRASSRDDTGLKSKLYSYGRKRTSLIYLARNSIWHLSKWYSKELRKWVDEFDPEVIFFASGDYEFAYRVAYKISVERDIPIVMCCFDDYYVNRANPDAILSKAIYRSLMNSVRKCVSRSTCVITDCDQMRDAYRKLFDKPVYTLYAGYSTKGAPFVDGEGIVYLGNLGYLRYKSLIEIGKALKAVSDGKHWVDVYSQENREEIISQLTPENGIVFHGAVSSDEVNDIISKCMLVIHTEHFSPENIYKVKYSISTKIADLLASGRCILAYGPKGVASMEYLMKNSAACTICEKRSLQDSLREIISNSEKRRQYVNAAKGLSERNHSPAHVADTVANIICNGAIKEDS